MSKIPEYSRLHCYFGCDEGGPLHHFPKPHNVERFAAWKAVLYDESQEKSNMYIYNTYKLCNKHFEKYYILPSNQLTRNAVPTLFLEHNTQANNQISVLQTSAELGPATHNPKQAPHNPEPATSKCLESGFLPSTRFSKQKNCVQGGTNKKIIQQLNKKVFKLTQKSKNLTKQLKEAKKICRTMLPAIKISSQANQKLQF
ncbi:uncharacterized protein LOC121736256 [Aricia agestis]|uniref:uncharacterized protein LOC121736256 n=1 Tax=Aricia agestis TaxID=91739 RepID=UPI001C209C69|nr:uncharacterized protein LOC121736256 [Aricia agestis]